ncbi:hypothetical protein NCC78_21425 [Micromonospora phytophila]|uniref:hypothetical protein n=1 Tax=Micromonospora phytophila TaxID=709888 RepID=UPI00202EDB31|nr:hypothetical protein [Micromonospora phytophila]MCM0677229.1 hypothetical protein [Micromonospora phytophila]
MALVTLALYTTYTTWRLGLADGLTDDVRRLLGRPPIEFAQFARDERGYGRPTPHRRQSADPWLVSR